MTVVAGPLAAYSDVVIVALHLCLVRTITGHRGRSRRTIEMDVLLVRSDECLMMVTAMR